MSDTKFKFPDSPLIDHHAETGTDQDFLPEVKASPYWPSFLILASISAWALIAGVFFLIVFLWDFL